MPVLTPEFLFDLETNMRMITTREYQRLTASLWWTKVAKTMDSQSAKERINWLLDTAKIERPNARRGGGQAIFEAIASLTTEYENEDATAGLKVAKRKFEDLDGNGVQLATHWSSQMGSQAAYWPQKELARAIRANPTTYDGQAFFSAAHPLNPFMPNLGDFANLFTGAASGAYPGALPIDESVSVEVAVRNIQKFIAYLAGIKMPNGEDPRHLRMVGMLVPPALTARAGQVTNAQFIAQSAEAAGAGGSGDISAIVRKWGFGEPIEAPELAAAFGGSDTSWYPIVQEITSDELGAFTYVDREPFTVQFHGPMTSAELNRKKEFEWTTDGRNVIGAGHPYLFYRCDAT